MVVPQAERVPDLVAQMYRIIAPVVSSGSGNLRAFASTAEHWRKYQICAVFTMSCQKMMWAEMISPRPRVVDVRPHRVLDRLGHPADDRVARVLGVPVRVLGAVGASLHTIAFLNPAFSNAGAQSSTPCFRYGRHFSGISLLR